MVMSMAPIHFGLDCEPFNLTPTTLVYADSLETSNLKTGVKTAGPFRQNDCHRSGNGCQQANEGQQIEGNDNAASGFNDQSKNVQQEQQPAAGVSPSTPTNPPSQPPSPPQIGTLLVTKNVTCPDGFSCPPPSDFTMHVTGTPGNGNPSPGPFAGSEGGTTVTLNLGSYNVTRSVSGQRVIYH